MCTSSRQYEDILKPRRAEFSNFIWVSRELHPKMANEQRIKPSPQYHKDEVLNSPKIQELLAILSKQQNISINELNTRVKKILDEIGYNKNLKVIRSLGFALVKICNKICSGIFVNNDSIVQLRSKIGNCPVIFVPSHRSYADFILMSLMCFTTNLAIPAIAAGMDFHGMWGMGTMLRDTGAFFMRRSYNDDSLYWTTFKQYVYQIVTKGDLPIEFFIEGTRSRANKSLSPKFGFIQMILKALFLAQVDDILFVPINITYERILEEKLFAFELLGIPKPKESTSGFFKSLSILKEKYGSIHFDFSEPISARQFFGDALHKIHHNFGPIHQQEVSEDEKKLVPALAHEIVQRQQKHCVISTFNLIAVIMQNNYARGRKSLQFDELVQDVEWLKRAMQQLGAFVDMDNAEEKIISSLEIHKNVIALKDNKTVTLIWEDIVLQKLNPEKLKAHSLKEKTLSYAMPFIMLQIYINPLMHYVIDAAVLVVVLKKFPKLSRKDELFEHYHFLRSLWSQEFVFFKPREHMEFESGLNYALELGLIKEDNDFYELGANEKLQEIFSGLLDCFLYSYLVVTLVLSDSSSNVIDEKSVLAQVQAIIEQNINDDNSFINPYALSLDSLVNCLSVLSEQKALNKSRNKGTVFYEIDRSKLYLIKTKLEDFVASLPVQKNLDKIQLYLKTKL